jgi:hypothetical protein
MAMFGEDMLPEGLAPRSSRENDFSLSCVRAVLLVINCLLSVFHLFYFTMTADNPTEARNKERRKKTCDRGPLDVRVIARYRGSRVHAT